MKTKTICTLRTEGWAKNPYRSKVHRATVRVWNDALRLERVGRDNKSEHMILRVLDHLDLLRLAIAILGAIKPTQVPEIMDIYTQAHRALARASGRQEEEHE